MAKMFDVSSNNGSIDWSAVAADGHDFCMLKASEGVGYKDSHYDQNVLGAKAIGLPFGAYHFASLNSANVTKDALDEADWFLKCIGNSQPPVGLCLDIEVNQKNLSKDDVELWINTFLTHLIARGYDVILYSSLAFLNENLNPGHGLGNVKLWLAEVNSLPFPILPKGWSTFFAWQYTFTGSVSGINGDVDLSRAESILNSPKSYLAGGIIGLVLLFVFFFVKH